MTKQIFLEGIALAGYRGIGSEIQFIGPMSRINLLIGQNNSGKSILLEYLYKNQLHKKNTRSQISWNLITETDSNHRGPHQTSFKLAFGMHTSHAERILEEFHGGFWPLFKKIYPSTIHNSLVWISYDENDHPILVDKNLKKVEHDKNKNYGEPNEHEIYNLTNQIWRKTHPNYSGGSYDGWSEAVYNTACSIIAHTPKLPIQLIPAKRQIGVKGEDFSDYSGRGLIDKLAELQNPSDTEQHKKKIFQKINFFLREVTESEDATIEIPHDRRYIIVSINGLMLPLANLGTGIHEVILIAAFCTLSEKQIVCLEEPEIHLHPLLQKKLIKYLLKETSNQYIIATHSASFLDIATASIFHVSKKDNQTKINLITKSQEKFSICGDLGYRASDLMQSNYIIWVEGPSDRIYIRHWLKSANSDLIEGIHYSVMFYGGRLLSHLTAADDDATEDFIALRRLNQNMAVIMDSDKSSDIDEINSTKSRINNAFNSTNGMSWITAGREIENYIDHAILQKCVKSATPRYTKAYKGGMYDHALHCYRLKLDGSGSEKYKEIDKVKVAKLVAEQQSNLDILDLRAKIEQLVAQIERAN